MAIHVTNAAGERQATYAYLSEALSYHKASAPNNVAKFAGSVREGEITVFDEKENEIGSILLPKDWKASETDMAEIKRYGVTMSDA